MHHKNSDVQHVILEAMLESRGHRHVGEDKHRYRHDSNLTPESVKKIYQSITPIFELSNDSIRRERLQARTSHGRTSRRRGW